PATGSWGLSGLGTIRGGTVTTTGGVVLRATQSFTQVLDGVTLSADIVVPERATLRLLGAWSNRGTFTVNLGTLDLGGTFTTAAIGSVRAATGLVLISGTLDNRDSTLFLNDMTGSWHVFTGGMIRGGTVTTTGGARLWSRGNLSGVTLDGTGQLYGEAT